ncbi:hypothetical protein GCM10009868_01100 [Terrabacter aerolatus]|uniref:Uncharacterized protein n=1 Tax=Terrabacter aerolatus TaxID=422442 RepID=A0A512D3B4_9MICO|nr:hypothetical protein TAE01_27560 [Terrabacter aerolatus]
MNVASVRVTGPPAAPPVLPACVALPSVPEPELQAVRAISPTVRVASTAWRERTEGAPIRVERDVMESSFGLIPRVGVGALSVRETQL